MITALALVLALAAAAQEPATGTVRGEVRSEASGAPLPGALVEVRDAALRPVLASRAGDYRLGDVPAGRRLLRASALGHEPLEVEVLVPAAGEVALDFSLPLRPVPLRELAVRGRVESPQRDTAALPAPNLGLAGLRLLESGTPGIAELGLGDGPRGPPGQAPVDPSDVLYVRGAPADLKLVLLDGAPVYTPFHVGGLLESFDAEVLRSAALYLGGAPARYDGGLSYILDLATRAGRAGPLRSAGAADLMAARAVAEGSAGPAVRYLVGGRGVHGLGIEPLLRGGFPYAYGEGLTRVDVALDDGHTLRATAYRNREGVALDSLGSGSEAGWANRALALRYRGRLGGTDAELSAAYGGFEAALPALGERGFPAHGETERVRLNADFGHTAGPLLLRYGASYDRLALQQRVRSRPADEEPRSWAGAAAGDAGGVYLEASGQPLPRLRLRGGLRADVFSAAPAPRLAPRLSASWLLGERAALVAAAGRYHQYVRLARPPARPPTTDDVADTLFLPAGLAVGRATHFGLALHQELDEGVRLGVEGFFKTFGDAAAAAGERSHASGVDLWVRRDAGTLRGWLGYSLTWVWSLPDGMPGASDRFAGRQLLTAGLLGPLGRWADLDLRVAYGAGLPFSAIPMDAAMPETPAFGSTRSSTAVELAAGSGEAPLLPAPPDDPYLRIDVGISRTFTARRGERVVQLAPYLRVLNPLDRRDALFYRYEREHDAAPRPVAVLPVLPLLGLQWRF